MTDPETVDGRVHFLTTVSSREGRNEVGMRDGLYRGKKVKECIHDNCGDTFPIYIQW